MKVYQHEENKNLLNNIMEYRSELLDAGWLLNNTLLIFT